MNYSLPLFRLSAVLTFIFNAFIMKAEAPDTVLLPHVIQYCISHEDLINNRWSELQVDEPAFVKDANGEKKATTELYFLLQKRLHYFLTCRTIGSIHCKLMLTLEIL